MTTNVSQQSAEILQFPVVRVRQAANALRELKQAELAAPFVAASAFGSSYHEAAIEDAKRARDH